MTEVCCQSIRFHINIVDKHITIKFQWVVTTLYTRREWKNYQNFEKTIVENRLECQIALLIATHFDSNQIEMATIWTNLILDSSSFFRR